LRPARLGEERSNGNPQKQKRDSSPASDPAREGPGAEETTREGPATDQAAAPTQTLVKHTSRPVYVEWIDSSTTRGWQQPDQDHDLRCWSLGFLVAECEESITLAHSVAATGDVCDQITIPRAAITLFRDISWV